MLSLAFLAGGLLLAGLALAPPERRGETLGALEALPFHVSDTLFTRPPAPLRPGDVALDAISAGDLMARLELADFDWQPQAEVLPDGGVRYRYRRREGDPKLSIEQIRALMVDPPRFEQERQAISDLLDHLQRVGVQVVLGPPRKAGAAGEWDPAARTIRIKSEVVDQGSATFALVLNHEAIHVAQSCRRGGVSAPPKQLGLSISARPQAQGQLNDPIYANLSPLERQLEQEAYAHQHQLEQGAALISQECRPPAALLGGRAAARP